MRDLPVLDRSAAKRRSFTVGALMRRRFYPFAHGTKRLLLARAVRDRQLNTAANNQHIVQ
jgi:hypothetical protein